MMSQQLKEMQKALSAKGDKKNVQFFQKMVPGQQKVYGVKTPELNLLAQRYKAYSFDLADELWSSGALEEKIIAIKVMEKMGKGDPAKLLSLFKKFSKTIDNWPVCVGLGFKFLRGIVKINSVEKFSLAGQI